MHEHTMHTGLKELSPDSAIPVPLPNERPTFYADRVGEWCVASKPQAYRKKHGLYLTAVAVAEFMAERITVSGTGIRILDPAAGAGILCCAAVEVLVTRQPKPQSIELLAYEIDYGLIDSLKATLDYLAAWCRAEHGIDIKVRIENTDFLVVQAEALWLVHGLIPYESDDQNFDIVISNPPYFKIAKSDPRAMAVSKVVHGQPNIYALFMAVSAALLKQRGNFIFITPRSFASGPYFQRFRAVLFDIIFPTKIHVFRSRREAFSRDDVLQENIIFTGVRRDHWYRDETQAVLNISSSCGAGDIQEPAHFTVPMKVSLDMSTVDKVLRLPLSERDMQILALVNEWPNTLRSLGLNISTGPVIPFRATELVDNEGCVPETHVPLVWMNHIRAMRVKWPLNQQKPEYIKRKRAKALLVPNNNYVLMRRFSAKEETRRLIAAPYIAGDFPVPEIGIENHLNYIYRPGGILSEEEAWGLAAFYNSNILDSYFRCVNGNTQVSATELRAMPLPKHNLILALGNKVKRLEDPIQELDGIVTEMISVSEHGDLAVG